MKSSLGEERGVSHTIQFVIFILRSFKLHVASHRGTKVKVEVSRDEHVFDDGLCGHFSQESDEEKLFYHRGGDSAE